MSSINVLAAQRRRARHYGIQALYQWSMTGATPHAIEAEFRTDNDFSNVDQEYVAYKLVENAKKDVDRDPYEILTHVHYPDYACLLYTSDAADE